MLKFFVVTRQRQPMFDIVCTSRDVAAGIVRFGGITRWKICVTALQRRTIVSRLFHDCFTIFSSSYVALAMVVSILCLPKECSAILLRLYIMIRTNTNSTLLRWAVFYIDSCISHACTTGWKLTCDLRTIIPRQVYDVFTMNLPRINRR